MTYLDTRDLIAELEALESQDELDQLENVELRELTDLRDVVGDEWQYGVTLIPADEFEDYARELAEGMGAYDPDASWPAKHIDWAAAADELVVDYTDVSFRGTDYLFRS